MKNTGRLRELLVPKAKVTLQKTLNMNQLCLPIDQNLRCETVDPADEAACNGILINAR